MSQCHIQDGVGWETAHYIIVPVSRQQRGYSSNELNAAVKLQGFIIAELRKWRAIMWGETVHKLYRN
jgi:hypothetical protein